MSEPPQSTRSTAHATASGKLGHPRIHLRRTDSTNDRLRALALKGAPYGTLVTAEEQTSGRGRQGRRWSAPPRSALLMSLLLRWPPSADGPALVPLTAAVAVCDAAGPQALLKWPNDVVLRRAGTAGSPSGEERAPAVKYAHLAKLAGILIEARPQEGWLVLGIGLNVAVELQDLPTEIRGTAASMGRSADELEATLRDLLRALERRLAQPASEILAAWRSRDALMGTQVTWAQGSGIAEGISDAGGLLARTSDGAVIELTAGEVQAPHDAWDALNGSP